MGTPLPCKGVGPDRRATGCHRAEGDERRRVDAKPLDAAGRQNLEPGQAKTVRFQARGEITLTARFADDSEVHSDVRLPSC
jgi:hypothetical protein